MTKDEKMIWAAVFAVRNEAVIQMNGGCREDCAILATEEADYTILALRRITDRNDGYVHRVDELKQEENNGRGIDVAQLSLNENESV